jgi:hypothetical protein
VLISSAGLALRHRGADREAHIIVFALVIVLVAIILRVVRLIVLIIRIVIGIILTRPSSAYRLRGQHSGICWLEPREARWADGEWRLFELACSRGPLSNGRRYVAGEFVRSGQRLR